MPDTTRQLFFKEILVRVGGIDRLPQAKRELAANNSGAWLILVH